MRRRIYIHRSVMQPLKRRSVAVTATLCVIALLFSITGMAFLTDQKTSALSGSDFKAGRIIDDGIFFNGNTMSADIIQSFLNAKVPVCDTNGTSMYNSTQTRAQYGASRGYPAPYTCLKDYRQNTPTMPAESGLCATYNGGAKSAAQMINEISIACGINPQAMLVLLQKEQSLVTDNWPWSNQYGAATGFSCPDTAPCDPQYSGLFYQIYYAARQFKVYSKNQSQFSYRAYRNNSVQFNPIASCGASNVYIENQATANLYIYTPYQPNTAALNNLYGSGDSCSAYGNRNFWRMFNDWFGPTISDSLYYAVIQAPGSPALFLQTSAGKYYIPSGEMMKDWGIDTLPVRQVSQSFMDSLPTRDWLNHLLMDDWGNMFMVEGGRLHYVREHSYLALWNLNAGAAVRSLGLAYSLQDGSWLGRFARDISAPNGSTWLADKGQKHSVDNSMLYHWRYTPDQLTTVSAAYLNSMTTAPAITQYASSGGSSYVIDSGNRLSFASDKVRHAYYGSRAAVAYDSSTLAMIPAANATPFLSNASNGQWFMLEGGRKHYVPNSKLAELWGKRPSDAPTSVSASYLASLTDAGTLSYVVQTSNPSMYWLIDGNKRYIGSSSVAQSWVKDGTSPPVYSNQSLDMLPRATDATTAVNAIGSPYTYTLENGTKHYLTSPSAQSAWGGPVMNVSQQLVDQIPEGAFVSYIVKNSSGQAYLLMNGTASYTIDSAHYDAWGVSSSTPRISDAALARYPVLSTVLRNFVSINGTNYAMSQGRKTPIRAHADAYPTSLPQITTLPSDYFPTGPEASYLARSSDQSDNRVWLINQGKKLSLTFEQQVTYGYLSRGVQPTTLSAATLNLIPDDSRQVSLLLQKSGSGIKLLSFGYSLGFPDGGTLSSYTNPSSGVLQVSPSIFDSFSLQRSASRLAQDDKGNYFLIDNGTKRYVPSWSILTRYLSNPPIYLEGTTLYLLPSGPNAN